MGEGGDHLALNWNSVIVNFTEECVAENDGVIVSAARGRFVLGCVEPEFHAVKEVEAGPINNRRGLRVLFSSEKDCRAEDSLEAGDKAPIVRAVFWKAKKIEHLGGGMEMNLAGLLAQGELGHPNRNEAILTEGQPVVRMGDDVNEEIAVAPAMDELRGRRSPEREPAEDERPSIKGEFLTPARPLLADEAD